MSEGELGHEASSCSQRKVIIVQEATGILKSNVGYKKGIALKAHAGNVYDSGCQQRGTIEICGPCHELDLAVPMCKSVNIARAALQEVVAEPVTTTIS